MANKKLWLGILAMTLVFGTLAVGCDNAITGSKGNQDSIDKNLVGKWYSSDDPDAAPAFEITASGGFTSTSITGGEVNVTTSGGVISATTPVSGTTVVAGTASYTVTGNKLELSNPKIAGADGGFFLSYISIVKAPAGDGYFYKSSSSGGDEDVPGEDPVDPDVPVDPAIPISGIDW